MTRDGVLTALPCHACGVRNDELHMISETIREKPLRGVEETQKVFEKAQGMLSTFGLKGKGESLAKENSLHVYEVSCLSSSFYSPCFG